MPFFTSRFQKVLLLMGICFVPVYAMDNNLLPAQLAVKAFKGLALDSLKLSDGRLLVAGERGHLLVSDDSGKQWVQKETPVNSTLTALAEKNGVLIAAGHDSVILRSTDRGETWTLIQAQPENEKPILDILFVDDNLAFAIGAYGYFATSTDKGITWSNREIGEFDLPDFGFPHLYRMIKISSGDLIVVGEAGFLARSKNKGLTWSRHHFPYEGTLFSVAETAYKTLMVTGMRGHLFRSDDGGKSFSVVETGVRSGLYDIAQTRDGRIVVAGMDGMILSSMNDGVSVTREQRPNRKGVASLVSIDERQFLLAAEDGASIYQLQATAAAAEK